MALRKCGLRKPGKAYFVIDEKTLRDYGITVQRFIQCPPVAIDPGLIAPQGITLLPRVAGYDPQGNPVMAHDNLGRPIYDAYDWIGGEYPDVVDFIEEAIDHGISRLNPRTTDFSKITGLSEYRLVHPRAIIPDPQAHYQDRLGILNGNGACPAKIEMHDHPDPEWLELISGTCAALWWEDAHRFERSGNGRIVFKKTAEGREYRAGQPPAGGIKERIPGIFMRLPIGKLGQWDVIRSDEEEHAEAIQRLKELKDGLFKRTRLMEY